MIRNTKLQYSTIACLLAILCYGLPFFYDNALGGLVKPTITVMAKSQKGGSQPPKKQTNTGGSLETIHTGSASTHPGVLKAHADKRKADAAVAAYAAKKKKKQ
jgi:hypothetical protein